MLKNHAERRARLNLPELNADHDCDASPDEKESRCYNGQWTYHGPHDYEVIRANWRGGGKARVHCPGVGLVKGAEVRSGAPGPTYGRRGVVTEPRRKTPDRIWIRWEGNVLSNGYPEDHEVLECLEILSK